MTALYVCNHCLNTTQRTRTHTHTHTHTLFTTQTPYSLHTHLIHSLTHSLTHAPTHPSGWRAPVCWRCAGRCSGGCGRNTRRECSGGARSAPPGRWPRRNGSTMQCEGVGGGRWVFAFARAPLANTLLARTHRTEIQRSLHTAPGGGTALADGRSHPPTVLWYAIGRWARLTSGRLEVQSCALTRRRTVEAVAGWFPGKRARGASARGGILRQH